MWHRDPTRAVKYTGVPFRSALEAAVAEQFDRLEVDWAYERGVEGIAYLPDFTILDAPAEMQLPTWVEVKPAELLYATRDQFGISERFDGDIRRAATADAMKDAGLSEIWKPKKLAEIYEEPVLVVSQVNRTRTLSVLMRSDSLEFSRSQPCVNWKAVLADREREAQHAAWLKEDEARRQRQAFRATAVRANNLTWAKRSDHIQARYDGQCVVCGQLRDAHQLRIARSNDRWHAFCTTHVEGA